MKELLKRDFIMLVLGQIISLFGNAVVRFALPLYLLNQTHSAALFGTVSAVTFIPLIILEPIGGIIADRVNKRNIMVILDFITAIVIAICIIMLGHVSLVALLILVLMILYGIQGIYQPAVQASIPALMENEAFNSANAVIDMVNSLAALLGPIIGGLVYAGFGVMPVLRISIVCLFCCALMEMFIHIPYEKMQAEENAVYTALTDLKAAINFVRYKKKEIWRIAWLTTVFNCVFSALIVVGIPVIITQSLSFGQEQGSRLYGYAQAALALGGLAGGLVAVFYGNKFKVQKSYWFIYICSLLVLPIGAALLLPIQPLAAYIIILITCIAIMIISEIFTILMISYTQKITPQNILGKIMALISCLVMCASPIGQFIYGMLFELPKDKQYTIFIGVFIICIVISAIAHKIIVGFEPVD